MTRVVALMCAAPMAALGACGGDDVELVKPTPNSAFRSTYPCQLLTKAIAQKLLSIQGLRRIGSQSSPDGGEQCTWARGRYRAIPQVQLFISPARYVFKPKTVAAIQRDYEKGFEGGPLPGYRALDGLGDRAFLVSVGRGPNEVMVEQDGRSFALILRLRQKPRSQPPPVEALEAAARDISARYTRPPG